MDSLSWIREETPCLLCLEETLGVGLRQFSLGVIRFLEHTWDEDR